ncbi:SNF2-related protein [Actinoplanes sp. CA-030573]|uniref:SNF2-related protein n=1 Tax=Actinoplanes sp. CA-030573 TaxID=3239898 RepID=UPI003D8BEDB2
MTDLVLGTRVLHGFVGAAGELCLWGESADRAAFALPASALPAGAAFTASLVLPSTSAGPLPSPQLGLPPRRGRPRPRSWAVPAVVVPFADDDLVEEFDGRAGHTVRWLVELCAFAADLVRRGRVLPSVLPSGPVARWRPVLTGFDAVARDDLLRRMPGACRAATGALPAADVLATALGRLVDGLVRTRLAEAGVELGDGWLAALTGEPGTPVDARWPDGSASAGGRWPDGRAPAAAPDDGRWPDGRAPSVGGRWPGGRPFTAAPALADELAERLDAWHASAASGAAVRLCFRLSHVSELGPEPDATDPRADGADREVWLLEFLLQAVDEPSALVTAADIWRDEYAPLRRWTRHPQERLLGGLGRAARLYPDLDAALRVPRPTDMVLDTAEAYRFLTQAAVLEEAGYGVLLPRWWRDKQSLGLALELRGRDPIPAVLRDQAADLAHLVDYQWGLALGGRSLTEAELTDLARAQVPLVKLRGRWVALDPEHLAAGLRFLERGGGSMTAGHALRMIKLLPPEELPLPVTAVGGKGWLADLLSGELEQRLELLDPPPDLAGQLRPYQLRGFSWLAFMDALDLGACLADDMGLGKTVQLLALLLHRRSGPALLICPLSVLGNWQREAARFAPSLTVKVLHGAERPSAASLTGADIVLTTYATAARDADDLAAIAWDRVVLDEAQHVKNAGSAVAKAVRRLPARMRIALTGTPVENRLAELWSILDFLNPGVLASAHTFRARFAVPIERYGDEDAASRLRHATRPFLLRRVKADPAVIDDLPDKRGLRHLCGLTTEQATLYRAVLDEMTRHLAESSNKWNKGIVLAAMTKLKQACVHPALLLGDGSPLPGRSGKLERLEEIVDGALADQESVLVFTQFAKFGAMLTPHLAARFGAPVRYLHGGTSRADRDALVAQFQNDDRPGVFVLSLKAGGTGLNLTAANHVVHVDRWWNPATEAQATDRAFRIGQRRDVLVHTLVCLGTLEERIDRLLADKGVLAERVVGNGEGWLTAFDTDALRELVRLAPEAIVD